MNKQGNLNEFFDVMSGNGTYAPRKRQGYASKRLQQVVSDFRSQQRKPKGESSALDGSPGSGDESEEGPVKKKVKTKARSPAGASAKKKVKKARGGSTRKKKQGSSSDYESDGPGNGVKERTVQLRPRPKQDIHRP
jgi:DNA excision repair protein ERCC-5